MTLEFWLLAGLLAVTITAAWIFARQFKTAALRHWIIAAAFLVPTYLFVAMVDLGGDTGRAVFHFVFAAAWMGICSWRIAQAWRVERETISAESRPSTSSG
jgi:hypothetical protein